MEPSNQIRETKDENVQLNNRFYSCDTEILKDITFIRILIDSINMDKEDEYVMELIRKKCLFGFVLEYQFPSLDIVSTALKSRIRINAKTFDGRKIIFRHRRVVRVKLVPEIINYWRNNSFKLILFAQLNTLGKYTTKLMGRCEINLEDLLKPPFLISQNYIFSGPGFSASSHIKIDVGSNIKAVMEYLEIMRSKNGHRDDALTRETFRSRSPSLSTARSSSRSGSGRGRHSPIVPSKLMLRSSSSSRETSPHLKNENITLEPGSPSSSYRIKLTVHSARRLPIDFNARGESCSPSTYVTFTGEDGQILSSPVRAETLYPEWEWTEIFHVPRSRQNLVIKLWRKCITGRDRVIGFISVALPPQTAIRNEYEMSDMFISEKAPLITISISTYGNAYFEKKETPILVPSPPITSPRLQAMSREEVSEKLRENMFELEKMLSKLGYR
ncbi:unnamed protein product [Dracunculus medinensis]|uniref:C2 domain-containing protein n=1 Tax=Dracunculus medinensis TaxID=318479 RepID=A0A0N4UG03_DRAME|nr:unnamed protein product [Dracunculus medinensis]